LTRARAYLLTTPAAVLLGYLVAHALLGDGPRRPPAAARGPGVAVASPPARPGPWRAVSGIPVGFARSEAGAVAAASNYLIVLSRALAPGAPWSWTRAIRALTIAPLSARALRASATSEAIARRFQRSGASVYLGSWLLGYRAQSYSPARARVEVWNVGVTDSPLGVVGPDYSTTTCTLRWVGGDWKVSDARVSAGPTPPPSPQASATHAAAFAAAARQFTPYTDVP
jgi:hypothetical protein